MEVGNASISMQLADLWRFQPRTLEVWNPSFITSAILLCPKVWPGKHALKVFMFLTPPLKGNNPDEVIVYNQKPDIPLIGGIEG